MTIRIGPLLSLLTMLADPALGGTFLIQQGVDSSPYSFQPSLPRGNRETMYAFRAKDENGGNHDFETYIRMDLPAGLLGPGERVSEAYLWVYFSFEFALFGDTPDVPAEIRCHEILEPWDEATMDWINKPAIGPVFDVHPDITELSLIWCDVSHLVQDWLTGARPNHGIALTNPTAGLIGMWSREASEGFEIDPNFLPSLVIETAPSGLADADADLVADAVDNCVTVPNALQADVEGDRVGDACDNCMGIFNPGQADIDANQRGDACDFPAADATGDGLVNEIDRFFFSVVTGLASGSAVYPEQCDLDGDEAITQNDLDLWQPLYEEFYTGPATRCGLLGIEPLALVVWVRMKRRSAARSNEAIARREPR